MAEFDAVIGGLISTPQKPTTYREEGEAGVMVILPEKVKVSQVLNELGRPLGERYLLLLSYFYVRGLLWKKVAGKLGNFISVHSSLLRRLGGEKYADLIKYGVKQKQLSEKRRPAIVGKQSQAYLLNRDVLSLTSQQRYQLTTKAAIRVRTEHAANERQAFISNGAVHRKIAESIAKLTFNYSSAFHYVATLPDGEAKTHRRNIVEMLLADGAVWSWDPQGRNYTIMVQMPRDLRRFFSYGKQPLYVVDITSSQPLLHVLAYSTESAEKKRYQSIVEQGQFWDFLNDAAGKPFDLADPEQKATFKEEVYQQVFYAYHEPKQGVTARFAVIFKKEFPILWGELNAMKKSAGPKQSGPLAKVMQRTEAEAVADAILSLKDKPYPLISIHDAIVTTKAGLADVQHALKQSFSTAHLNPMLAVKKLTA
jgi:hypothetical protein